MNGNGLIEPLPSNSPRVYTESLAPNYTSSIINYAYNDSTFLSQFSATDYIRPVFGVPNNSDNIFYLVCSYNGNIGLMKINKQTEYLNW
jgi:hypothetical protein